MKQNNFTITVFSNTAETAKARFKADIKIFNYGVPVELSDTNIYKADSIDELQSELYHHQDRFGKEYNLVVRSKAELKSKIEDGQTESFAMCFKENNESYVVMILEDENGSLIGYMRHVSCRNDKGRFISISMEELKKRRSKFATSAAGAWVDGENGPEFSVSFFTGNASTIKLSKDKKEWKNKQNTKAKAEKQEVAPAFGDEIMIRFAEMEARMKGMEQEIATLKARVEELEAEKVATPAANDEELVVAPTIASIEGITSEMVEEIKTSCDLRMANEKLEKKITGTDLNMDDLAVILRGDLKEIASKFALRGSRAERDRLLIESCGLDNIDELLSFGQ